MLQKIKRFFLTVLLLVLLLGVGAASFVYFANYSEGTRAGRLIKLSRKGFVFKTYEGQLDTGGLQSSGGEGGGVTSLWDFSVPSSNRKLIAELEMQQGKMVKLRYEEKYYRFFWRGETRYFITRVEPAP